MPVSPGAVGVGVQTVGHEAGKGGRDLATQGLASTRTYMKSNKIKHNTDLSTRPRLCLSPRARRGVLGCGAQGHKPPRHASCHGGLLCPGEQICHGQGRGGRCREQGRGPRRVPQPDSRAGPAPRCSARPPRPRSCRRIYIK